MSQAAFCSGSAPDNMWDANAVIYGGTRIWVDGFSNISDDWRRDPLASLVFAVVGVLDAPLSLVADTVLLPITLIEHAARKESPEERS